MLDFGPAPAGAERKMLPPTGMQVQRASTGKSILATMAEVDDVELAALST